MINSADTPPSPVSTPLLVAVDMDGTFLDPDGCYDRVRFSRIRQAMREAGCRFVIASGNQYYHLRRFFDDPANELSYVAENGALVVEDGSTLSYTEIPADALTKAVTVLLADARIETALCCLGATYVQRGAASQRFFDMMSCYFPRIGWVDDLLGLDDVPLKLSLSTENGEEAAIAKELSAHLGGILVPTVSGNGSIDLMMPACTKAAGISLLADRWRIPLSRCVAFGDNDNDIEMLGLVGTGYAMENASERARSAAARLCPSNREHGVLQALEDIFGL